jgi:large subunit ribosomal protein L2
MQLKKKRSCSAGVRHQVNIKKDLLAKYNNIFKQLSISKKSWGGRNNTGKITIRHKGSGVKKKLHPFIFQKNKFSLTVFTMYNGCSNSFINLNFDLLNRTFFKSITSKNVSCGSLSYSSHFLTEYKLGYNSSLKNLPLGSLVNSVTNGLNASKPTFAKSAGEFCQIIQKKGSLVQVRLPSGKFVFISSNQNATLGCIENGINKLTKVGKAGRNRLKGIRPSVRGVAMNPVDHPHGGKSNKGMTPVTPWGLPTRNRPTVKNRYE